VVKVKQFAVRMMTVDEAIEQMELLSHDFFLFLNNETGQLTLLYRRKDKDYGLIVPKLD
jgi:putative sigma-54 modulation protein